MNALSTVVKEVSDIMNTPGRMAMLRALLPKHLPPERLLRIWHLAMTKSPQLAQCTVPSLVISIMEAARLGLEPDGVTGQAYIVPFAKKEGGYVAQLIPGYRGLIKLACEDSNIEFIEAVVVYEGDKFRLERGTNAKIEHVPNLDADRSVDKIIGAYAIAKYRSGLCQFDFMTKAEIEAIRARSKAKIGPWQTDYAEMAKKTVVRRLCKYLNAKNPKLERALAVEAAAESGEPIEHEPIENNNVAQDEREIVLEKAQKAWRALEKTEKWESLMAELGGDGSLPLNEQSSDVLLRLIERAGKKKGE